MYALTLMSRTHTHTRTQRWCRVGPCLKSVISHRVTISLALWRLTMFFPERSHSTRSITKFSLENTSSSSCSLLFWLYASHHFLSFQLCNTAVCVHSRALILPAAHHPNATQNCSAAVCLLHFSFLTSPICISKANSGYVGWCTHWLR